MRLFDMMTSEDIKRVKDSDLATRIEYLEGKCREAGRSMIELNMKYEASLKEIDRLSEENDNLKVMLKGADGRNNSS